MPRAEMFCSSDEKIRGGAEGVAKGGGMASA